MTDTTRFKIKLCCSFANFTYYAYIKPGKLDLLFRISHFPNLRVGGISYSLFVTSTCYIHSANLRHYDY